MAAGFLDHHAVPVTARHGPVARPAPNRDGRVLVECGVVSFGRLSLAASVMFVLAAACGTGNADSSSSTNRPGIDDRRGKQTTATGLKSVCPSPQTCLDFELPSGNIDCFTASAKRGQYAQPAYIECSGVPLNPEPDKTVWRCELDWAGINLSAAGKPSPDCRGDVPSSQARRHKPTLEYGRVWQQFGITCLSQRTGLVCINLAGHGFFYARERWKLF